MMTRRIVVSVVAAAVLSGCSYTLPQELQQRVDTMNNQTAGMYTTIGKIKEAGKKGDIDASKMHNVEMKYNELVKAHDTWLDQVNRVISKEIQYFENDEQYLNSVDKLINAGDEFEKAADATGAGAPADVPDFSVEARELMTLAFNDRKMKKAASEIDKQLRVKRWNEI